MVYAAEGLVPLARAFGTPPAMQYYRIEVRLLDVRPAPWRRFLLKKSATFENLHLAIQDACDWGNCHLYGFHESMDGPALAGIPDDDTFGEPDPDASKVKLASFFSEDGPSRCFYQYDFGDNWWHAVRLVETVSVPGRFVRRLEAGARAFPPEDCGGIPGYENCVSVATDKPSDAVEDPEGLREWLGDWHPERFDLAAATRAFEL